LKKKSQIIGAGMAPPNPYNDQPLFNTPLTRVGKWGTCLYSNAQVKVMNKRYMVILVIMWKLRYSLLVF